MPGPSPPAADDPVDFAGPTHPRAGSGVRVASSDTLFKAGDRVAENIQLVSLLGVGGMGDVWLANHIGLETAVAVKFMSAALAHDRSLIERFAREAKLASRIKSPHVVQIFDFATTHQGIPYIVMELIEGETLESRIRRDGKLGLEQTSRIVVQLSRALTKAHEIGIVHRDMKPDNVLLGEEDGELFVRILDFGIAKYVDAPKGVTDVGVTMGTPSYMSPEQLFHQPEVDHRSDLWSLGVITYLCLTGGLPFQGDSFAAICVAINAGVFAVASKVNPEIPLAMDGWFAKALAVSPDERFRSAKEMSDAYFLILEESHQLPTWAVRKDALDGEAPSYAGVTGALPASLAPPRPARGRRRHAAALVVAAAMLLTVGFLSRDATIDQFVKTHVPGEWTSWVERWRAGPAPHLSPVPSPPASTEVLATGAPTLVAAAPVAKVVVLRPGQVARPVLARAVAIATAGPPINVRPSEAVESPSAEAETNPYAESGAFSGVPLSPSPDMPDPDTQRKPQGFEPHAPGL